MLLKGEKTYTTDVDKNKPSPTPFTARPAISIPRETLLASTAAPIPNTTAPSAIPLSLPTLFARCPPKKEEMAAGIRIVETTRPCTVEDRVPNVDENCGIVVRGPMVPVSSLGWSVVEVGEWDREGGEGEGTRKEHRQRR
jgi:hypothetical protein